jgi:hypothetical protein
VAGSTARQLITFDLSKLLAGDATHDRVLQADDEVRIFNRREVIGTERVVTLSGYAKKVGPQPLLAGMRVSDILKGPGGFEDPDFRRGAYLPRLDVLRPVARGDRMEKELRSVSLGRVARRRSDSGPGAGERRRNRGSTPPRTSRSRSLWTSPVR